jgi:hypothetical protein
MDWLAKRKYLALLLALGILVAVLPVLRAAPNTRMLFHFMLSVVFLAALVLVFPDMRLRLIALVLGVPTILGLWTGYLIPGLPRVPLLMGFHLLAALFFAFSIGVILNDVFQERGLSTDSVYGVFCGYLMAGLGFGHLYSLVDVLQPNSFRGDAFQGVAPGDEHFLLTYFSFLTLTTVGYGDIVPANDAARGFAVIEAIMGQFYIAVLVASLIGKRVSQTLAAAEDERDKPPDPPPPP